MSVALERQTDSRMFCSMFGIPPCTWQVSSRDQNSRKHSSSVAPVTSHCNAPCQPTNIVERNKDFDHGSFVIKLIEHP